MKRPLVIAAMMWVTVALLQGCGGGGDEKSADTTTPSDETLAARVDDWTVTRDGLQKYIDQMTEQQKRQYDSHEGRAAVAGQMIEEQLFYREAGREGMLDDAGVKAQIEEATRRILIQAYYSKYVAPEAEPSEEELHDYYEAHQDVYTSLEVCHAQHIFAKSEEKLNDIKERIVTGGEKFTTMAHRYSEDKITQADGGDLGYFNPGGYIRGVGFSTIFSDSVFQMEPRKVYGPLKWEKGYSLVYVLENRPAGLKPYADVRGDIRNILIRERLDNARIDVVQKLVDSGRYDVRNYMDEFYKTVQRSPQELWAYAQTAEDPQERLAAFQEIVDKFPQDEIAPQALFMVGFVYAEELRDYVTADRVLTTLVDRYPGSEYSDMARWMMDNMGKDAPRFEDMDDVNKRMKEDAE